MNRRLDLIQTELVPYMREITEMLKVINSSETNPYYNPKTGEDMYAIKLIALKLYIKHLMELDEHELLNLLCMRQLN